MEIIGLFFLWEIISPLLLKNSSSKVIPTDIPALTVFTLSFSTKYSIVLTFVVLFSGEIRISSPTLSVPASTLPAIILLLSNLYTSCIGNLRGFSSRPVSWVNKSNASSTVSPLYQGNLSDFEVKFSP